MIRRQMGDQFLLITQNDHARLSGQLAVHYGNSRFTPPNPRDPTLAAIAMHDCGWPLHDDLPTLSKKNFPVDVFETPLDIVLRVWEAAADRAEREPDYTQLLISLHVLGLSALAASNHHTRPQEFDLNRFQHREIERQEQLRQRLGLSTEAPLRLGLAVQSSLPAEEQLKLNHSILQAMDRISLALCCNELPFSRIENLIPRPGRAPQTLEFSRSGETSVRVAPWPFDARSLTFSLPHRSIPAMEYDLDEFRAAYAAAPIEHLSVTVHA